MDEAINNTGITDGATLTHILKHIFFLSSRPLLPFLLSLTSGVFTKPAIDLLQRKPRGELHKSSLTVQNKKTDRSFKMPGSARLFLHARRNKPRCSCRRGDNQRTPSHVSFHNCRGKLFFFFFLVHHTLLLTHTSPPGCGFRWELIAGPSPADRRHAGYWVRLVTVERLC